MPADSMIGCAIGKVACGLKEGVLSMRQGKGRRRSSDVDKNCWHSGMCQGIQFGIQ